MSLGFEHAEERQGPLQPTMSGMRPDPDTGSLPPDWSQRNGHLLMGGAMELPSALRPPGSVPSILHSLGTGRRDSAAVLRRP